MTEEAVRPATGDVSRTTYTRASQPHQRVADPAPATTARPSRRYPTQPDEFLRRARALDTDTDANVRVLRRLLGEGAIR